MSLAKAELLEVIPAHAEVRRVTEALPAEVRTLDGLKSLRTYNGQYRML
jgi:hypothetical protein